MQSKECPNISLIFTEGPTIYYQNVSEEVIKTWINFLEPEYRGSQIPSDEVNAVGRNKIERDALYNKDEKKKIHPDKDCIAMFAKSNKEARKVVDQLFDMKGRKLVPVDVTADSLYDSLLCQISRKKEKYKSYEFRKQIAYFLTKHPEWFAFMLEELNIQESYESFIMNLCQGLSMPHFKIVCAVVTKMWNITIDIVTPKGVYKMYHQKKCGEAVLVWNGVKGIDSQFCGSKIDNPNWHPIKGLDWSGDVKNLQNIKAAAVNAEKCFRSRTANKIVNEYNEVSESILTMKETLVQMNSDVTNMEKELKSMKQKIDVFASNVYKMEGKQGVLRLRLIELGVTVDKFSEPGSIVQGFQEFKNPQEPPHKKSRTATVSKPEDIGTPPDFSDMTPTMSISAEVHTSAALTPSTTTAEPTPAGKPTPSAALTPSTASTSKEIEVTKSDSAGLKYCKGVCRGRCSSTKKGVVV